MVAEGDRKAFYDASQWTIKQNNDTLALVKKENKDLREALIALQKVVLHFELSSIRRGEAWSATTSMALRSSPPK
jgi:hypothetical protein